MNQITATFSAAKVLRLKGPLFVMVQSANAGKDMAIKTTKTEVRRSVKANEQGGVKVRFEMLIISEGDQVYNFIQRTNNLI